MKKLVLILLTAVTLATTLSSCGTGDYLPCPAYSRAGCGY